MSRIVEDLMQGTKESAEYAADKLKENTDAVLHRYTPWETSRTHTTADVEAPKDEDAATGEKDQLKAFEQLRESHPLPMKWEDVKDIAQQAWRESKEGNEETVPFMDSGVTTAAMADMPRDEAKAAADAGKKAFDDTSERVRSVSESETRGPREDAGADAAQHVKQATAEYAEAHDAALRAARKELAPEGGTLGTAMDDLSDKFNEGFKRGVEEGRQ